MVITKLQGGLGNQMFQFAAGLALAKKKQTNLYLDIISFNSKYSQQPVTPRKYELNIFDLPAEILTIAQTKKILRNKDFRLPIWKPNKKLTYTFYKEPGYEYRPYLENTSLPVYLDGYFQSHRYFSDYKMLIQQAFSFEKKISHDFISPTLTQIINENSVSVHIRRGDYIADQPTNQYHGTCSIEYYKRSIERIANELSNPHFFFFSDDISWVKQNFSALNKPKTFVAENFGSDNWKDMYFMSKCKHHIIANSTFSWWGAWLSNQPEQIVIAPQRWFQTNLSDKDLIPNEWIRL
ncbi:MAG: alpha-1,2-fucosyltransferase [Bacteroidetes bacterium]|nr:alpha-1,2-fucosyltransferase [Bacteroidota bacterium]